MTKRRFLAATIGLVAAAAVSQGVLAVSASAPASRPYVQFQTPTSHQVEAELRTAQPIYQVGQPVWVEFVLRNLTTEPLTLAVPNALTAEAGPPAMGLPLSHVFSGVGFGALTVIRQTDQTVTAPVSRKPASMVAPVVLAPFGSVGVQVDATQWYPALRQAGEYRLQWKPYGGSLTSNTLTIKVMAWKDAVIQTEYGNMRIRLYYDKAPRTVEHFLEMINKTFYDNRTFHRVLPGFIIQGGSPTGDGTGVQTDCPRLKAEINNTQFQRGTVAMALAGNDPDSASCQFFITLSRLPDFDNHYTAFGELVGTESFDTLAKLEQVELSRNSFGEKSLPTKPLRIQAVLLENAPRPMIKTFKPGGEQAASPGMANR